MCCRLRRQAAVTAIGSRVFGTDMVSVPERLRYIPQLELAPGQDDVVAGARLASVHAIEGLAAHVAHGAWSRTVDDQLVGVVDADPLFGIQRHRESGRVIHRSADRIPMSVRIDDIVVLHIFGCHRVKRLVEGEHQDRRHAVEAKALDTFHRGTARDGRGGDRQRDFTAAGDEIGTPPVCRGDCVRAHGEVGDGENGLAVGADRGSAENGRSLLERHGARRRAGRSGVGCHGGREGDRLAGGQGVC